MKRLMIGLAMVIFTISLAACSGEDEWEAPTIEGVEDEEVLQGSEFDSMEGVTATDYEGNDLTDDIEVDGFVNTSILGEHNLTYTVEDKEGMETSVNRYITVIFETEEPYQVYNGNFELDTGGWTFDKPGGEADWSVEDDILNVDISDPGNEWWQLQIYQLIEIEENQTYTIEVTAKGSNNKSLGLGFEDTTAGYEMIAGGAYAIELSDSFETHTFEFQSDRTIDAAKFVLYLGQMGADEAAANVEIDSVTISLANYTAGDLAISGAEDTVIMLNDDFDPLEGVTATNGDTDITDTIEVHGMVDTNVANRTPYVLQYIVESGEDKLVVSRVVDVEIGAAADKLFNPDFTMGVTGWTVDFPGNNATGTMNVVDDVMEVDITDMGSEYWHIQLSQSDRAIEEGKTYELSFTAKADGSKTVGLGVEDAADGFAALVDPIPEFALSDTFETYTHQFSASSDLESVKYALFFGQMDEADEATKVYVDSFSIREVVPSGESVMENPDMDLDTGWVFDFPVGEGTMNYVDGTVEADITNTGDAWWHIQLQQAGINVDEGVTYLLSATLKSSEARTVGLGLEDADDGFASVINEDLNYEIGPEYETIHYVFTPEASYENLKVALFLGNINDDPESLVTVESIDLTVADDQNILQNSTFEDDSAWAFEFNETAEGTMSVADNTLIADVTNVGEAWWHIQLAQESVSIQEGESYLVSFRASSTEQRRIGLGIEDPADGFRNLKSDDPVEWDLTDEMTTYTFVFDSQDTLDTAKFAIFMGWHIEGDAASTIEVKDFFVVQLVE